MDCQEARVVERRTRHLGRSNVPRPAPARARQTVVGQHPRTFEELEPLFGNELGLVKKGLLMLCKDERTLAEEAHGAEKAHALGIPAEVLTPEQTAQVEPGIRMDVAGSVYYPQDCHLTPQRFLTALTHKLEEGGVAFCWSTEVTGWVVQNGRIAAAQTNAGEIFADEYVLAGGSWSAQITRGLKVRLPMQVFLSECLRLLAEVAHLAAEAFLLGAERREVGGRDEVI